MAKKNHKEGQKLPMPLLSTAGGTWLHLSSYRGRKLLVYCWASWSPSRDALSDLQKFYETHRSSRFSILSIAMDVQGPERPMQYLVKNHATFATCIDPYALLSRAWGIKSLPAVMLLDESGHVMLSGAKLDYAFLSDVEKRLSHTPADEDGSDAALKHDGDRQEILMQACTNLLGRGRKDEAAAKLHEALKLDPENDIVRTQILVLTQPERFYQGKIDTAWLNDELDKLTG